MKTNGVGVKFHPFSTLVKDGTEWSRSCLATLPPKNYSCIHRAVWTSVPVRICWTRENSLSTAGIRTVGHRIYYTDYAIAVPVTMDNNVSFLLNSAKGPNCTKLLVILTLRQVRQSLEDFWFFPQSPLITNL
jgi:hypothetical protein